MNADLMIQGYSLIEKLLWAGETPKSGFAQLVNFCKVAWPREDWTRVEGIQTETDVAHLQRWLRQTLEAEPPPEEIVAFWFGLYSPVLEDGTSSCDLYISGSTSFDERGETNDWAGWRSDSYLPSGRYAQSQLLKELVRVIHSANLPDEAEYTLCLGYGCLAVRSISKTMASLLDLRGARRRGLGVGFDSGDFIVGLIDKTGWSPLSDAEIQDGSQSNDS